MMTAGAAFAAVPLIGAGTAEPGWEKLPTEAYPGKRDDISFADPLHGWYGTGKGDLFRTIHRLTVRIEVAASSWCPWIRERR